MGISAQREQRRVRASVCSPGWEDCEKIEGEGGTRQHQCVGGTQGGAESKGDGEVRERKEAPSKVSRAAQHVKAEKLPC